MTDTPRICDYCQEERIFDLLECWPKERAWIFETCCEEYHDSLLAQLEEAAEMKPHKRIRFLAPLIELFAGYGIDIRQAYDSETEPGSFRLDFGLELTSIEWRDAKAWISKHHQHNVAPRGWRWGHAVRNGDQLVGVATIGRPVARAIDGRLVVEVTRNCMDLTIDPELRFQGSGLLYRAAEAEARARGFVKIITYTLESEPATALKELGWIQEATTKGGSWNTPSRPREDQAPTCRKIRWAKYLTTQTEAFL